MKKITAVFAACLFCFSSVISAVAYFFPPGSEMPYYEPPRPDGYHECIGDILALKLSLTDDPDYKYMVLIQYNGKFIAFDQHKNVPELLDFVNRIYDAGIDKSGLMRIDYTHGPDGPSWGEDFFLKLTREQINILTRFYDELIREYDSAFPFRLLYVGSGGAYTTSLFHGKLQELTESQFCELRGDGFSLYHEGINRYGGLTDYYEVNRVYPEVKQPETTMLVICMIVAGCAALLSLVAAIFSILSYKKANRCSTDEH